MFAKYFKLPRQIHILCLGTFINRAGSMMVPFLTIYLQERLHLGEQFATLAMGCYGLGAIVAMLVGGHLADTIGRRTMMIASLTGGACILLLFGRLTQAWEILSAVVAFALIADMYRPAASAMVADLVGPQERPAAYGLMYVAINLGFAVGPSVGGMLAKHYSFTVLFVADACTALIYAGIIAVAIRETLPGRGVTAVGPSAGGDEGERVGMLEAIGRIIRDRVFLAFAVATLLVCMTYMQSFSTLPLYMKRRGIEADVYGRLIALNGLLIVIFQLPITAWTARFHRVHMVSLAAVLSGVGFGLMALCHAWWQFALSIIVWTVGEMLQSPYVSAIVADMAPARLRARYMGIFIMCYSSANMLGAPLGGWILTHHGGTALWLTCLGLGAASATVYVSLRGRIAAHHAAGV